MVTTLKGHFMLTGRGGGDGEEDFLKDRTLGPASEGIFE